MDIMDFFLSGNDLTWTEKIEFFKNHDNNIRCSDSDSSLRGRFRSEENVRFNKGQTNTKFLFKIWTDHNVSEHTKKEVFKKQIDCLTNNLKTTCPKQADQWFDQVWRYWMLLIQIFIYMFCIYVARRSYSCHFIVQPCVVKWRLMNFDALLLKKFYFIWLSSLKGYCFI